MGKVQVDGVGIEYEIIGNGERSAIITPGGRYTKEAKGLRELAEAIAKDDFRVVLWDRPNSGGSDVYFGGATEAEQNADMLAGLLRALGFAPAMVVGGSGGARPSLLAAIRHPDVVERLFLLWLTGGVLGGVGIAFFYCHDSWLAAATGGMEAVAELPLWKDVVSRNPRNREILLRQDPAEFMAKMNAWGAALLPKEGSPVADFKTSDLNALRMPVMILRSGKSDFYHPRVVTEALHAAIPGSQLVEPPFPDREFTNLMAEVAKTGQGGDLFARWPMLAPQILSFANS
jgi:pimeloyl-ACP methyl ester carboxylesterase